MARGGGSGYKWDYMYRQQYIGTQSLYRFCWNDKCQNQQQMLKLFNIHLLNEAVPGGVHWEFPFYTDMGSYNEDWRGGFEFLVKACWGFLRTDKISSMKECM